MDLANEVELKEWRGDILQQNGGKLEPEIILIDEILRLRAAVKEHHGQKADDRCEADDIKLYAAFGLEPHDSRVGDKFEMAKNCLRFIDKRCTGGGWPTYRELEEQIERLEIRDLKYHAILIAAGSWLMTGLPSSWAEFNMRLSRYWHDEFGEYLGVYLPPSTPEKYTGKGG